MKRLLLATVALMAATPAFAQSTSSTPVVEFSGERAQVCEVRNFDSVVDFGSLSNVGNAGDVSDTVRVFCNVRFDASIESANGFLKLDTIVADAQPTSQSNHTAQGYPGFSSALDYSVSSVLGSADTSEIDNGSPESLGTELDPIDQQITLTYDTIPETQPLLGGDYEDTITLTLTPIDF